MSTSLHIIVQSGTYTKHIWWFWQLHETVAEKAEQSQWSGDTLPFNPGGHTATVTVEGGDFSARRTLKFVLSKKGRKNLEVNLKNTEDATNGFIKQAEKEIEGLASCQG